MEIYCIASNCDVAMEFSVKWMMKGHRRSHHLHFWNPAEHLRLVNPCNFRTLDRFKRSWLATATDIWNGLPADIVLQGEVNSWHTMLKDTQRCVCNYH